MDISEAQDGIESMAILMASYYSALIRNGMPEEMAQRLTEIFQVEQIRGSMMKSSIDELKLLKLMSAMK